MEEYLFCGALSRVLRIWFSESSNNMPPWESAGEKEIAVRRRRLNFYAHAVSVECVPISYISSVCPVSWCIPSYRIFSPIVGESNLTWRR